MNSSDFSNTEASLLLNFQADKPFSQRLKVFLKEFRVLPTGALQECFSKNFKLLKPELKRLSNKISSEAQNTETLCTKMLPYL